ncbi:DNA helicase MCM9-like 2, partial [Homarus americanus]
MLESLVRLSQGHAKLMMRTEVTVQDAIVAVTLMEATMCGASVIAGINPLHTSFPHSPGEDYKHQDFRRGQRLCCKIFVFDILSDEVTRLNQQRKLFMNWKTAHPKASKRKDKTACGVKELDDVPEKNSKRKQQQTLPQMSKNLESSTSSSDLDVSFSTARNDNEELDDADFDFDL